MQNDIIKGLIDLGVAFTVDGYSESINELIKFEAKYAISSSSFYDDYNNFNIQKEISDDDKANWIFYCNVFLSCGGELKKFEKDQILQSLLESKEYLKITLKNNRDLKQCKEESEECKNPRFNLYWFA